MGVVKDQIEGSVALLLTDWRRPIVLAHGAGRVVRVGVFGEYHRLS
jgi:hypothetical protein